MSETALASRPESMAAAGRWWRGAGWVFLRVLAVAVVLELFYLLAANAALSTKLVEKLAGSTDDVALTYRTAWSLWPGHVEARDVSLRAKDYNVEFLVLVDTATLHIALSDLFRRRFHATSVKTTGTVYRMRHHVHSVGDDGPRLAAYPSIAGLPDPPLFVGPEQPPLTDAEYNLWEIQLEDVHAEIAEVWILEYRYRGAGTASGRFHLRPARWFEVGPAALQLSGGELSVNDVPVATRVTGRVECFAEHTVVENVTGLAVLHGVSGGVHLSLEGTDLSFANVYAHPEGVHVSGHGSGRIDFDLKNAVLSPGGVVEFAARPLDFRKGKIHFGGPVDFRLRVGPPGTEKGMVAEVSSKELAFAVRDKQTPSPSVHGLVATAVVEPRDVREDFAVTRAELSVARARAPSLAWFNPLLDDEVKLDGSAVLEGRVSRGEGGRVSAAARSSFEAVKVELTDTWFRAESGEFAAELASSPDRKGLRASGLDLDVKGLTFKQEDGHTAPVAVRVLGDDLQLQDVSPLVARGTLRARAEPAHALLPLVVEPAFLRTLAKSSLGLARLDTRAEFRLSNGAQRVDLLDLRSGKLRAHGAWEKASGGSAEGAFLISAADLNLGVKLRDGKTDVKLFAGDDWLAAELRKLGRSGKPEPEAR